MEYNFDPNRKLYIEVKDGVGTKCIEATKEQIDEARLNYLIHETCDCKLIYDEAGFIYDSRICGICGEFITHI